MTRVNTQSRFIEMFEGDKFKKVRLGDYTDLTWGDTNTTKNSYVPEGYLAFSAGGPDGKLDHYDYDQEGIVLSAIGADCGKTWFTTGKWSCIKNTIRFWSTSEELDNYFLFLATRDKEYWPRRGGAQPFIPQTDARNCVIPLPSLALQRQFISFANQADKSKFSDFKSRFIEMFGRIDSKKRLGDVASYINGFAFKPSDWTTSGLPIIRIQNLTGSNDLFNYYNGDYPSQVEVNNGDILISWSATLGVFVWAQGKALLNQHIFKVSFDKGYVNRDYFIYAVTQKLDEMATKTHGTTMRHIVKSDFDNTIIPFPDETEQDRFATFANQADKSKYLN